MKWQYIFVTIYSVGSSIKLLFCILPHIAGPTVARLPFISILYQIYHKSYCNCSLDKSFIHNTFTLCSSMHIPSYTEYTSYVFLAVLLLHSKARRVLHCKTDYCWIFFKIQSGLDFYILYNFFFVVKLFLPCKPNKMYKFSHVGILRR